MFCPKCKSLMYPQGGKVVCRKCGYCAEVKPKAAAERAIHVKKTEKEIPIYTDNIADTLPIEKVECSKCGNREAYWYLMQTRKADEAETRFYQCTKCGHRWREY